MSDRVLLLWIVVSGVLLHLVMLSPLWVPVAFIAFAIWKRRFGIAFLLTAITAEAISTCASIAVFDFLEAFD
jgi:hypothetical protein